MYNQKKILAIHDISCTGRCSLTVALPILSVAGLETAILPTAVLSTHTGGFTGFTHRDLTDDIIPITDHWKTLGLKFDAIYSGYLGSVAQIDMLIEIFKNFKKDDCVILVDPVMGDNGKLYSLFDDEMVRGMKKLCGYGDIIIPNITEATFLVDMEYIEKNHAKDYIEEIINKLVLLNCDNIVLTGVSFENDELGVATFSKSSGIINYHFEHKVEGSFHGTGDIFGSSLLGAICNDFNIEESAKIAVSYTNKCIKKSLSCDKKYGVMFELELPYYIDKLKK